MYNQESISKKVILDNIKDGRGATKLAKKLGCSVYLVCKYASIYGVSLKRGSPHKNIIGKKFGKLTVKTFLGKASGKDTLWLCQCDCSETQFIKRRKKVLMAGIGCSCGCDSKRGLDKRKGTDILSLSYFSMIKRHAKDRNLEFCITIEFASKLLKQQKFKCALTGWEITTSYNGLIKRTNTASIDRKDSTKGYTEDNIQWVHKDINKLKMAFEENYFKYMCRAVTEYENQLCGSSESTWIWEFCI
jgi:hypothetical protein